MSHEDNGIGKLNGFLRGEIAAVETYRQALELSEIDDRARVTLQQCLLSHERRVAMLDSEIRRLGGDPVSSSGAWGIFAKLVEKGAKAISPKAAVAALEEGEDLGQVDYQRDLFALPVPARSFLTTQIIPEQERTHEALRRMDVA